MSRWRNRTYPHRLSSNQLRVYMRTRRFCRCRANNIIHRFIVHYSVDLVTCFATTLANTGSRWPMCVMQGCEDWSCKVLYEILKNFLLAEFYPFTLSFHLEAFFLDSRIKDLRIIINRKWTEDNGRNGKLILSPFYLIYHKHHVIQGGIS